MTFQLSIADDPNYLAVLDKGFVGIVDSMGNDAAIVQAARVSYGAGTKTVNEDRGLIRYLLRHKHTTPFEMCDIKFHVKCPILTARQWLRHRTASVNEESARYSVMADEFYFPDREHIQPQSSDNKQGRSGELSEKNKDGVETLLSTSYEYSHGSYKTLLGEKVDTFYDVDDEGNALFEDFGGVARELARTVMPVGAYTEFYWKANLHNLFHFLKLRADPHAQYEIRVFANAMIELTRPLYPLAFEAWEDYSRYARNLSRMETSLLRQILVAGNHKFLHDYAIHKQEKTLKGYAETHGMSIRELNDFVIDFYGDVLG